MCTKEEFWICVGFIFEEMKKVIFMVIMIFFRHMIFFTYPTDNLRRDPTKDSIGCKFFIYRRDKRVIQVVR